MAETRYITRDDGGQINGDYSWPNAEATEAILTDAPEFVAYKNPPPAVNDYQSAVVSLLDATAQSRRYDNAVSISTYVTSTHADWAAEASAFVAWRDAVWAYAYVELDKVLGGQRAQPTVAELLQELPAMVWPNQG